MQDVKHKISDQQAIINEPFNFTIPDTAFIDDDGNNTLVYHSALVNGIALPAWLNFDTITGTFTGTPTGIETLRIRVTATEWYAYIIPTLADFVFSPASLHID